MSSLDRRSEQDLVRDASLGDASAQDRLIGMLMPRVVQHASERAGGALSVEELVQEGSVGLLTAIRTFRESEEPDFAGFADTNVTGHMDAALQSEAAAERDAAGIVDAAQQFDRTEYRLAAELHRKPTAQEMAKRLEWTVQRVESVQELVEDARRRHDEELLEYLDPEADAPADGHLNGHAEEDGIG